MVAVAVELQRRPAVAAGQGAGDVRRRRPLQEGHAVGRVLVLQPLVGDEQTPLDVERRQPVVLERGLVDAAGVLRPRAPELGDEGVVDVPEQLAVHGEPRAAEVGPRIQVPRVGGVAGAGSAAEVAAERSGFGLMVVRHVEVGDGVQIGGETAIGAGQGGLAVRQGHLGLGGRGVADVAQAGGGRFLERGNLRLKHRELGLQGLQAGLDRIRRHDRRRPRGGHRTLGPCILGGGDAGRGDQANPGCI